jgi:membrane protease YdiL (CAAX protease family)
MNQPASFLKRQELPVFCALTVVLSFAATQLPIPGEAVPIVMVFVPALVALTLTAIIDGWSGVGVLLGTLAQWRVHPRWIVIALALGFVMRLAMSGVAALLGLIPAVQLRSWTPVQLALFAILLFIFAIPEELGWRGYALPRMLARHSALVAGLMLGMLWGTLHLALHLSGMIHAGLPLLPVVLEVTGLSILGTWLYIRSGGKVLLTSLFHAAQSFFVIVNEGITQAQQLWLMAGVYGVLALVVAIAAGPGFVRKPTAQPTATGQALAVD